LKSGSLNLLEPSGPVQACNGIALSLPLPILLFTKNTKQKLIFQLFPAPNCKIKTHFAVMIFWDIKESLYRFITDPEGSRRLRLPDFQTLDI